MSILIHALGVVLSRSTAAAETDRPIGIALFSAAVVLFYLLVFAVSRLDKR